MQHPIMPHCNAHAAPLKSPIAPPRHALRSCLCASLVLMAELCSAHLLAAAVPTEWTVRIGPRSASYQAERRHGDALNLRATLTYNGQPLAYTGPARLYAQTNGMGSAWWDLAPCTVVSNTLQATWLPSFDTGADVVDIFLGGPSNYQAAARIRFLPSPGSTPNALPLPVPVLDFSTVIITNAPFALSSDVDYSTSNTQLVATIEATAPAPGNYLAVSNAAMNARSKTDMVVYTNATTYTDWKFSGSGVQSETTYSINIRQAATVEWYEYSLIADGDEIDREESQIEHPISIDFTSVNITATRQEIQAPVHTDDRLAQVSQIPDVPSASDATPLMDGDASAGTTNAWARGDHIHPSDTSKLDGAAAYLAWDSGQVYEYPYVVSYDGRLWRAIFGPNGYPGQYDGEWELVTFDSLKQDTLPYPTNAIPYAAITGAPTPPSVFYDTAGGAASVSGATLTYQAASNSVGSVALLAGTNVLHITAPSAIPNRVRDFGLTVTTEDAATVTLDSSVSWRFDAASTNLSAGSWNRIYCTESPTGVFSLQLWTPDSSQEATP